MMLWKNKLKPILIIASKALEQNNGTAHFKKCKKKYLNTIIYSYLETSGGQSSNLYINVVNFFNDSVN
jgi:hypothetical protein